MADGLFDDLIPAKKQGLFDDLIPGTRTPVGASPAPLASAGSGKAPPQLGVWNPDTGRFDTDRIPRAKPQQGYFGRVGSAVAEGAREGWGEGEVFHKDAGPVQAFGEFMDLTGRGAAAGVSALTSGASEALGLPERARRDINLGITDLTRQGRGMFKPEAPGRVLVKEPLPVKEPPLASIIEPRTERARSVSPPAEFKSMTEKASQPTGGYYGEFARMLQGERPAPKPDWLAERRSQLGGETATPRSPAASQTPGQAARSLSAAATPGGGTPAPKHPFDFISEAIKGNPKLEAQQREQEKRKAPWWKQGAMWFKDHFSPEKTGPAGERAALLRREAGGLAERDTQQGIAAFEEFRKQVGRTDLPTRLSLWDYIEGRSAGVKLIDEKFRAMVDAIREQMESRRAKLENLDRTVQMGFIDDYLRHFWSDPKKARQVFGGGKTGEGGFTKKRTTPTFREGMDKGLVPVTTDPIEAAIMYIQNADKWINHQKAIEIGRKNKDIRFYKPGSKFIPDGYAELKSVPDKLGFRAYAARDYARVWNNNVETGFMSDEWGRKLYPAIRQFSNSQTAWVLGLSAFHAGNMVKEAIASRFAKGMGELVRGDFVKGLKSIGTTPLAPLDPFIGYASEKLGIGDLGRGRKFREEYLNIGKGHGAELAERVDIAARSGFRAVSYDDALKSGTHSLIKSFKRGTLKLEALDAWRSAKGSPAGTAVQLWKGVGRVMETVAAPLFEQYIPALRRAAFDERMQTWLEKNPTASEPDKLRFGNQLSDSIDNRFGEMNMNNIFWRQAYKQALQVSLLSYSWTYGTMREIGGGVLDGLTALKSGKLSPRSEYVMALFITSSIINSVYQYIKTGALPGQDHKVEQRPGPTGIGAVDKGLDILHDLQAPRTGGIIPADRYNRADEERARTPGPEKDIFGYFTDPKQEIANKISPFFKMLGEAGIGKNWRNDSTIDPQSMVPGWLQASAKAMWDNYMPISIQNIAGKNVKQGTNIGSTERFLGIAPATGPLQNYGNWRAMRKGVAESEYEKTLYHDMTAAQKRGDREEASRIMRQIKLRRAEQQREQAKRKSATFQ